jgi:hypothetical protein
MPPWHRVAAGATFLPWVGLIVLLAPLGGKLAERIAPRVLISTGVALLGVALLFSRLDEHSTFADMFPAPLLGGLGGSLTTRLGTVVIGSVTPAEAGVASGIHNAFRETGGTLGIGVVGAVFAAAQTHALAGGAPPAHAFVAGYSHGLELGGPLMIAAAAIAAVTLARGSTAPAASYHGRRAAQHMRTPGR